MATKNVPVDVWLISTLATAAVEDALAGSPMSVDEFAIYGLVADLGPITAADLVRATGLKPTTLSGILTRCERRGELERVANPADRRSALLRLTDHGTGIYRAALPALRDLLTALDAATVGGTDPVRHALQTLDDALRAVRGIGARPYRLEGQEQTVIGYDGPPLTPAHHQEVRRYIEWLRHRDADVISR